MVVAGCRHDSRGLLDTGVVVSYKKNSTGSQTKNPLTSGTSRTQQATVHSTYTPYHTIGFQHSCVVSRYGSCNTGHYKSKTQFCIQNRRKPPLPVSSRKVLFCFCKMTRYGSCKTRQYKSETLFCFCFYKMTRNSLNECKTIELNRILVKAQKIIGLY
jgi:hypothetical protein